ncbi:Stf0 family sulfotransferase [Leptothoe spongobia]|uniref:Sulfotransferase domain-containing protein n=1 Tax=Leptothoe spongobia TAU-MAC 1115 TaxID=1967444 RepID=A0A947GKR9_9CYAN|nr:Stf0 family sulfotransferase [Leptothoe spongobia]MBT9317724.1 sulfotransferase domain-containing protein [Leptothoe spongobia TAU-MAC 1115]
MLKKKSYIICTTPRCGSSLLCELLSNTGILGYPKELETQDNELVWRDYYKFPHYKAYLDEYPVLCTSSNGITGVKLMWMQLEKLIKKLRATPEYAWYKMPNLLNQYLPNCHYIYLRRHDKLRQAVSFSKAIQTGVWSSNQENINDKKELEFDFNQINDLIQLIYDYELKWFSFFKEYRIKPLILEYEFFHINFAETIVEVLNYLNLDVPEKLELPAPSLRKQSDKLTELWIEKCMKNYQFNKNLPFKTRVDNYFGTL